jgi:hypothetical protein
LRFDPLEERALLSITPLNTTDVLTSEALAVGQNNLIFNPFTTPAHSIATDNKGDFAVVWSATNYSYDAATGVYADEGQDIYAQYYTNDVQQVTLPAGLTQFSMLYGGDAQGHVVQDLSFTATNQPYTPLQGDIAGTYALELDGTAYKTGPIKFNELVSVEPDTGLAMQANAEAIQKAMQLAGGPFAGATVLAIDARDYEVHFGAAYNTDFPPLQAVGVTGLANPPNPTNVQPQSLPLLQGINVALTQPAEPGLPPAFLPAVEATMVKEPFILPKIPVSATNPFNTAAAIENWFTYYAATVVPTAPSLLEVPGGPSEVAFPGPEPYSAPVDLAINPPSYVAPTLPTNPNTPLVSPGSQTGTAVTVVPLFDPNPNDSAAVQAQYVLTHFQIEFVGDTGTDIQAPLEVLNATTGSVLATATIIKQSSGQFMVNQIVTDPTLPPGMQTQDNENPAVAMDPNGNFMITWQSSVPVTENPGSGFDIYARRFTPTDYATSQSAAGWTDNNGYKVPCVLAVAAPIDPNLYLPHPAQDPYTIRVNNYTPNDQYNPDVATDSQGDFVVVWEGEGQELSFFNSIGARRFTRTGHPVGGDILVSREQTNIDFLPYVAMDNKGDFGVAWGDTFDPNYLPPEPLPQTGIISTLEATVLDANGNVLLSQNQIIVPGGAAGYAATIAFDDNDNFVIGWDEASDQDQNGTVSEGVYGAEWELYEHNAALQPILTATGKPIVDLDANGDAFQIRPKFRVNSGNLANWQSQTAWSGAQYDGQVTLDADGDLTVTYDGAGPAVSENTEIAGAYYATAAADPANVDIAGALTDLPMDGLLPHPSIGELGYEGLGLEGLVGTNGDPQSNIESTLIPLAKGNWNGATYTSLSADTIASYAGDTSITVAPYQFFPVNPAVTGVDFNIDIGGTVNGDGSITGGEWATVINTGGGDVWQLNAPLANNHYLGENIIWTNGDTTAANPGVTRTTTLMLPTTATTIVVADAGAIPAGATTGQVLVEDPDPNNPAEYLACETMTVTAVAAGPNPGEGTLTVTRGAGSVPHALNATVVWLVPLTPDQLGRISAILNNVAGLLRGEADGVMFSQFDADPDVSMGPSQVLLSDSVANNMRDGNDQTEFVVLDRGPNWNDPRYNNEDFVSGQFQLYVFADGLRDTVTIPVAINGNLLTGALDWPDTGANLDNDIGAAQDVGTTWAPSINDLTAEGAIDVRLLPDSEIASRTATAYDVGAGIGIAGIDQTPERYYVYEVTFQGEVANNPTVGVSYVPNSSTLALREVGQECTLMFNPGANDYVNNAAFPEPRSFNLSIDGKTLPADLTIDFNPADYPQSMNFVAGELAAAIQANATLNPALGMPGFVTVTYVPPPNLPPPPPDGVFNPPNEIGYFDIVFGGGFTGIQHTIQKAASLTQPPPAPAQGNPPQPDYQYKGGISVDLNVVIGVAPKAGTASASDPGGGPLLSASLLNTSTYAQIGTPAEAASIAVTRSGNFVMAWTQDNQYTDGLYDAADPSGNALYTRQYEETTDTSGPQVAGLYGPAGTRMDGGTQYQATIATGLTHLVVSFDEDMRNYPNPIIQLEEQGYTNFLDANGNVIVGNGPGQVPSQVYQDVEANWADSVTNPTNYQLMVGKAAGPQISLVQYGLNEASMLATQDPADYGDLVGTAAGDRYEAVLTFASPLPYGTYTLTILHPVNPGHSGVESVDGNPLNMTGFVPNGADATLTFTLGSPTGGITPGPPPAGSTDTQVSPTQVGSQIDPSVAIAANGAVAGNFVVVWTSLVGAQYEIVGQMFSANKTPIGTEFIVSATANVASRPEVAMDAQGDFVVVWSGAGPDTNATTNTSDVFARVYDFNGNAHQPIQVNVYETGVQNEVRVAVNPNNGSFVVVWTSYPQPATAQNANIFYREFLASGSPAPGPTAALEQQVDVSSPYRQCQPDVAMDQYGDFDVVWTAYTQNGNIANIDSRYFNSAAGQFGSVFALNTIPVQVDFTGANGSFGTTAPLDLWATGPRVSMDVTSGNYVATWADYQPSTPDGYNVYYRQYAAGSTPMPGTPSASSEQIVGTPTAGTDGWQLMPAVGMAPGGGFTVVWTSFGHDNAEVNNLANTDYGVYFQMYSAAGATTAGPFRLNATTVGDQVAPAISYQDITQAAPNAAIVWDGPTGATALPTGIFVQILDPPPKAKSNPAATTTTLVASADPAVFGQAVTFTATVKAGAGTPTGSVTFEDGSAVLGTGTLSSSGTATFTTSTLAVAGHAITASYVGTASLAGSTSAILTETVKQAGTTTTLVTSAASRVFGQAVTFTATVKIAAPSTATPAGTVTFKDGSTVIYTATLTTAGTATFTTSTLAAATHTITASYVATVNVAASTSAALTETVKQATTTTALVTSATSTVFGQAVTFTATVKAGSPSTAVPTGVVTFKDGTTVIGTGTLTAAGTATFTTSTLAAAATAHKITASYAATANLAASTSAAVTDTVKQATTSISLAASLSSPVWHQTITFTATLKMAAPSAAVPTGLVVTFKDGTSVLGTATLNAAGTAVFQTSSLAVGTHAITVSFAGNTNLKASSSTALSEVVSRGTQVTVRSSLLAPAAVDQVLAALGD